MAGKNNDKKYEKMGLSYDKAMAYIANRFSGKSARAIAQTMGKGERTISRYIADFDEYVQQSDEYGDAVERIVKMIPMACDVWDDALTTRGGQGNPDVSVANNIFKAIGLLKERGKIEGIISNNSDTDLLAELMGLLDGSINDSQPEEQGKSNSKGIETPEN